METTTGCSSSIQQKSYFSQFYILKPYKYMNMSIHTPASLMSGGYVDI